MTFINKALPVVVIPAYRPTQSLIDLINLLVWEKKFEIIVINDGTNPSSDYFFSKITTHPEVKVLHHQKNLGKGRALKTAIEYYLANSPENHNGIITADADGQHHIDDILKISIFQNLHPQKLVLGTRGFEGKIPYRSQLGNRLTRYLFKFCFGRMLYDTQTGLRAIPRYFLPTLLDIPFNRYEFELEMLVKALQYQVPIEEVSIKTIYQDKNISSHFNPLLDSLKIYYVFARFFANSMLSSLIDYVVFALCFFKTKNMLISLCTARIVAASINFTLGRTLVFKSNNTIVRQISKYIILATILMTASYGLLRFFTITLGMNIYLSKFLAEAGLFFASFTIQNIYIFNSKNDRTG